MALAADLWALTARQRATRGRFSLSPPWSDSLTPGDYVDAESPSKGPILGVMAQGKMCPDQRGQFDLVESPGPPDDEAVVTGLLVSFELTCADAGGTLRGCVSYKQ